MFTIIIVAIVTRHDILRKPLITFRFYRYVSRVSVKVSGMTYIAILILEWTTSLDTSSRTLYWNGQLVLTPALGLYL